MADAIFDVVDEIRICVENQIPIIVVPGSSLCDNIIKLSSGDDDGSSPAEVKELIEKGHFFYCNSTNSEDIAQLTHLLLSITPWWNFGDLIHYEHIYTYTCVIVILNSKNLHEPKFGRTQVKYQNHFC